MDTNSIAKCDLLKMDVEGAEYAIFYSTPSAVLRRIRSIVMELHRVPEREGYNYEALEMYLRHAGFTVKRDDRYLFAEQGSPA